MAVKKNKGSLNELREFWQDQRERIAAEYYVPSLGHTYIAELFTMKAEDEEFGRDIKMHLIDGIPVICVHDGETGNVLSFLGDDMGSGNPLVARYANDRFLEPVPAETERIILNELKNHINDVHSTIYDAVFVTENEFLEKHGIDREDSVIRAICNDVILDENNVTYGRLYYALRAFVEPVIAQMPGEILKRTESFFNDMVTDGHMTDQERGELQQYCIKKVSDMFHPWSILKGRLNHQVGNLGELKGEVTAADIAKVATWAEDMPLYAPYKGAQIETWVKDTSKHMRVKLKDVYVERESLTGRQFLEPQKMPQMSEKARKEVSRRF